MFCIEISVCVCTLWPFVGATSRVATSVSMNLYIRFSGFDCKPGLRLVRVVAFLFGLFPDERVFLQRVQNSARASDNLLSLRKPGNDLNVGFARYPGLDGNEFRLVSVEDVNALDRLRFVRGGRIQSGGFRRRGTFGF